jgi:NAD(P)-dependent dehydrogenase (short-subunit alcohol dehydrogenase family)
MGEWLVDESKVAVFTGSSSGIGFETSLMLARSGFHTFATMRKAHGAGGSKEISDFAKNENLKRTSMVMKHSDRAS